MLLKKVICANIQKIIFSFLAVTLLVSCSPKYITKTDVQRDTVYQVHHLRDSVYLHDSVSVSIHASNDTVYIDKYKSVIRYREYLKTDTVKQIKEIVKKDTKVVEVKKKNSWFSTFIYGLLCGGFLLLILQSRNSKMN